MHVPGWHEATKEWQEAGDLQMVGIIQEQHPDRARLFMQWKEMGWPILIDSNYGIIQSANLHSFPHAVFNAQAETLRQFIEGGLDILDHAVLGCTEDTVGNITISDNPAKLNKKIDTALKKMVKKWQKMKKQMK